MNKLDEIIAHKHSEVEKILPLAGKLRFAAAERNEFRSLLNALAPGDSGDALATGRPLALIAEVKKASPSAGTIAEDFDPLAIAKTYEAAGASAISVLTDQRYFQGNLADLTQIRREVSIPVLRKDFVVHEVQIYESVVAGADAILLIVAALKQELLIRLLETASTFQLDVLVEVHNLEELDRAQETEAQIIGINNRNLKTFEVDLGTTERLAEQVEPNVVVVSESGIKTAADARNVKQWGADAILVGETLMRANDVASTIRELTGV